MTTSTDSQRRPVFVDRRNNRFFADPLIGNGAWPQVPLAVFYGSYAADPASNPYGSQIAVGDLYFNTSANILRVWDGSLWQDAGGSNSSLFRWKKTAAGGETSLSGLDDGSTTLTYTPGSEFLYLNGALLARGADYVATTGTSITGLAALTASDVVEVFSFNALNLANLNAGTVAFTQSGTGAVQRTVEGKLRDVISVKDFGAVGDGVTDDTAAIQAAINSIEPGAVRPSDGVIYFPPGEYFVTATINIRGDRVDLIGSGRGSTTIKRTNTGSYGPTFRFAASGTETSGVECFSNSISSMKIIHAVPGTASEHIRCDAQQEFKLYDLELWNPYVGARIRSGQGTITDVQVRYDPTLYTSVPIGYAGFWTQRNGLGATDYSSGAGQYVFTNCKVYTRENPHNYYPNEYSFLINSADGIWLNSCYVRGANTDAFSIWPPDQYSRTTGVKATNCWADWPKEAAFRVKNPFQGNVQENTFIDCYCYAGSNTALVTRNAFFIGNDTALGAGYTIRGTSFTGAECINTREEGVIVAHDAEDTHFVNSRVFNASFGTPGTYYSARVLANVSRWSFVGGALDGNRNSGVSTAARALRVVPGTSDNYWVIGVSVLDCVSSLGVDDNGTGVNKMILTPGRPMLGLRPPTFLSTALPNAANYGQGTTLYVSDLSLLAYSDGTNWRKSTDATILP